MLTEADAVTPDKSAWIEPFDFGTVLLACCVLTVMFDTPEITGIAALVTVTFATELPVLPRLSVTEKTTGVVPIGKVVGASVTIVFSRLSNAV